jgi:hypothetical protein
MFTPPSFVPSTSPFNLIIRSFRRHDPNTVDEWTSVLALSSKYFITPLRDLAIDRLAPTASGVDKVVLATTYSITNWLETAYTQLCMRNVPINAEESARLGQLITVHISEVQHQIRLKKWQSDPESYDVQIRELVRKKFRIDDK